MLKFARTFATVAGILIVMVPSVSAQKTQSSDDKDDKEIAAYRLNMATVKKWETTIRYLSDWVKTDPEAQAHVRLQASVDALRNKEELTESEQARLEKLEEQLAAAEEDSDDEMEDDASIDDLAAKIARFKPVADALRRAGMTPREYIVFSFALFHASASVSIKKAGIDTELPVDVSPANIRFVEEHWDMLAALQKEMERVSKGLEPLGKKGS